jgi:hypothetical protein
LGVWRIPTDVCHARLEFGAVAPAGVITAAGRTRGMDRQQLFALFFAFLMVSSMAAWGVSLL